MLCVVIGSRGIDPHGARDLVRGLAVALLRGRRHAEQKARVRVARITGEHRGARRAGARKIAAVQMPLGLAPPALELFSRSRDTSSAYLFPTR
jgi:hypothetical protein